MCKNKVMFCCLSKKLTKKTLVFSENNKRVKQIKEFLVGGAISLIMSGIYMKRMEKDCLAALNTKLCKSYVNDAITKRKKNAANDNYL